MNTSSSSLLTEADLVALLADHELSDMSLAAFARQRGVPAWRLYEARRRARRTLELDAPEPVLVPVQVKDAASPTSGASIEVELPTGRVLRVPADFDPAALARLTQVLEQC